MKATKHIIKALASVLVAGALLAAPAGAALPVGTSVTAEAASKKVKLSATKATLDQGKTKTLTLKKSGKKVKGVKWTSSNASVATVSSSGKVKAIAGGSAKIKATYSGKKYTCKVTVRGPVKGSLTLTKGQTYTLTLKNLSSKQKKSVKWSTSKKSVVTLKKSSKTKYTLTAKGTGNAKITVKAGGTKFTCTVTVKAPASATSSAKSTSGTKSSTGTSSGASTSSSAGTTGTSSGTSASSSTSSSGTSSGSGSSGTSSSSASTSTSSSTDTTHTHSWVETTTQVQTGTVTVVDTEAYDEEVCTSEAWDEDVYEEHEFCNVCGIDEDANGIVSEDELAAHSKVHMLAGEGSGWHNGMVLVNTIHHDAVYETVHHDAVTHEEPVYTTVTTYVCSICGATK